MLNLGGTNISAGRIEKSVVVKSLKTDINPLGREDEIVQSIVSITESVYDNKVKGIGIGVPSLVDIKTGIVYDVQNIPSWKKVPLKKIIEEYFNVPVYINNDDNCFAVGEKYFGKGKEFENIVGLTLGTGLGAGIIINNRLYSGKNCGAGEFGSLPYKDSILEDYCSSKFFINQYHTTGEVLYSRAQRGDRQAIDIFEEFGSYLGDAVISIMFTIDPDLIVLGGSISKSYKFFIDSLMEKLEKFPYKRNVEQLVIEKSERDDIVILGAAALYLEGSV